MTSSLSNLVNNLSEGIHKIKCKFGHDDKKWETCGITYEVCDCFLEYTSFKDDLIEYKCLWHNKNYQQKFDKKLIESQRNDFLKEEFSNHDNNKLVLLLRKDVHAHECYGCLEKFNETSLPEKKEFYSHLIM